MNNGGVGKGKVLNYNYNRSCGYVVIIVVTGIADAIMWITVVATVIFLNVAQNIK